MAINHLDGNSDGARAMPGEFDARLTVLERHAISTEKRLDGVDTKLDQIMAAVTVAGAKPAFNPAAVVGFIKDAGILIGMAAAAIIYISANLNSAPLAVMQVKMDNISQRLGDTEDRLRWKPEIADSRR
jgi:hypothetical protein